MIQQNKMNNDIPIMNTVFMVYHGVTSVYPESCLVSLANGDIFKMKEYSTDKAEYHSFNGENTLN